MDCCDIFYPRDAAHVTARFLFYGLLEEVPASPENYAGLISKNKYVKLTTLGENIVKWGKRMTLAKILKLILNVCQIWDN